MDCRITSILQVAKSKVKTVKTVASLTYFQLLSVTLAYLKPYLSAISNSTRVGFLTKRHLQGSDQILLHHAVSPGSRHFTQQEEENGDAQGQAFPTWKMKQNTAVVDRWGRYFLFFLIYGRLWQNKITRKAYQLFQFGFKWQTTTW